MQISRQALLYDLPARQAGSGILSRAAGRSLLACAVILLATMAYAQAPAVSPAVDPTNGFPLWYQDANGLRVEACLDASAPCVLLPLAGYDPTKPVVFPTNFPSEFFYLVADSDKLTTPGCPASGIPGGTAKFRGALEGSFFNGAVKAGEQITFTRTKVVADGLCPSTAYTFTHPYGADVFTTDALGQVVANKKGGTIDIGCQTLACNFGDALASRVFGAFLRFDPNVTPPPPGYLGDAAGAAGTLTQVLGPANGTNVFSITDPQGNLIASTNLFTVSGKIAGPLMSSPTAIDFGGQSAGTPSIPKAFTITNVYSSAVTISGASISGTDAGDFSVTNDGCSGQTIGRDGTCTISLTFTPAAEGVKSARLDLAHDAPFRNPLGLTLAGTGIASISAPVVSLSATSLDFGGVRVRTTGAEQVVTVSNSGNAPLGATVSIINADPNTFPAAADQFRITSDNCTGNFVSAGGTCTVKVNFAPTVAAASTAVLSFADNAADTRR